MKTGKSEVGRCDHCGEDSLMLIGFSCGYVYLCPDCCKQLITALSKELGGNASEEAEHYKKLVSDANKKVAELQQILMGRGNEQK